MGKDQKEISFISPLDKFADGLYQYHLKVPQSVVEEVKLWRADKRVLCNLNGRMEFYAGILTKNGIHYIMLNKTRRKKLDINQGEDVTCILKKSGNEYGIEIPDTIAFLFEEDSEFKGLFHQLTMGKQRSLLHMIDKIKSDALRAERTILMAEHLKELNGKLDFKMLLEKFKRAREEKS